MNKRLFFLDNIRIFLTILVIIFHTSIAYGAAGSWILEDVDKSEINATIVLLTIFTAVCQSFFMGLFFFISSYFFPISYERKGAVQFLRGRLVRLGIPLLIYYFVIGPMTVWFAKFRDHQTLVQFYKDNVWSFRWTFFGPTWFLEASIFFALFYILFRFITKGRLKKKSILFPNGKTLVAVAFALGLIAFVVRLVYPTGTGPLELQLGYFPSYILLFIAGIIAQKQGWLEQIPEKLQRIWTWVAIGMIPVLPLGLILTGGLEGDIHFEGGFNIQALLYAMWEPFICLGIILFLLSFFQRRFNKTNRLSKWLSENAYTVYLIHPPIIVGWTLAFHGIGLPAIVKWIIVSALSVCACFIVASAIRALPYVRRVL
ncbi:acyltransferase family protein [Paenibacillus paeoniae]|uniref:Acyltransferase n=1 Tax=Paenibacillus paeoniae TaxID=2292705 RepID=A0A371PF91_9BACL|nr:acyltransferase family protein [Paenibacillus paeoniae]REK74178.1 acyltransferase [Paenibacillus paeoniae]